MPYTRSAHRVAHNDRVSFLLKKARRAQRLRASDSDIRDLVFQCSVFLASAATETYVRLLIESWVQKVRTQNLGTQTPVSARAYIATKRLAGAFAKHAYTNDERALYEHIGTEMDLWRMMAGAPALPGYFDGKALHDGSSYPSGKNIKKLFARAGINNMLDRISSNLGRDAEVLIEGFQSVRTALAHSSPPALTIVDVEDLLSDNKALVGAIDRIFFSHVNRHGGALCWTA